MVISQKKGRVRYTVDLDRKTLSKFDFMGEQKEKICPRNLEKTKKVLSEAMVNNLAKMKTLESQMRFSNSPQLKQIYLQLKKQNHSIIRFTINERLYR